MGIRYFFLWINAKTFENDRIARYYVSLNLCAYFKQTRLRYFRSTYSF